MCFCCHFQRSTLSVNGLMTTSVTRRLKIFMYTVDDCRVLYKDNNKITELRTILQRERPNS